eukprot:m.240299 g.240299  ORF g.240299 m.240299 type:complete len:115 (+) comp17129_c2_seq12:876-1220(+)
MRNPGWSAGDYTDCGCAYASIYGRTTYSVFLWGRQRVTGGAGQPTPRLRRDESSAATFGNETADVVHSPSYEKIIPPQNSTPSTNPDALLAQLNSLEMLLLRQEERLKELEARM